MILFHVTEHKNLPSILTGGLIPAYRRGLTRSRRTGFRMHVLWLTDNFWWILNRQVAQPELHSVIVLNCEGLKIETHVSYSQAPEGTIEPHEFIYRGQIEPSRVEDVIHTQNARNA